MGLARLLNVTVSGPSEAPVLVFLHGFGCGQDMWRHVAPSFVDDFRVVLLDLPGSGNAAASTYDPGRHGDLRGYGDDVIAVLDELELSAVTLVGHSVSAMISVLVQIARPDLVERLVLVTPSARYIDDGDYVGGFSPADVDDLLELMSRNHLGWQETLAGMVAGPDSPGVKDELETSFCRNRPEVASQFAAVTFYGDNRADLPAVSVPSLVLQDREDVVAPMSAGRYVARAIPGCRFEVIETRGHCPQLTAPVETAAAIRRFLAPIPA